MKSATLFTYTCAYLLFTILYPYQTAAVSITDFPSELPLFEQEPDNDNEYYKTATDRLTEEEMHQSKNYFHINLSSTFYVWAQTNKHTDIPHWEYLYTELGIPLYRTQLLHSAK
ncbi:hypothetical protein KDK77_00630 [bacterium]|nr:hypothetical protein [bacterium]